jgi:hypothetical protein
MYPLAMSLPVNLGVEMSDKVTSRAVVGGSLGEMLIPLVAGMLIHSEVCTLPFKCTTTSILSTACCAMSVVPQVTMCANLELTAQQLYTHGAEKTKAFVVGAASVFCAPSVHAKPCIEVMHAFAVCVSTLHAL